jgi:putative MFS transporter
MFDSMDVGLISFIVATLAREWKLSPGQVAWLISIGLLGMLVGAATAGSLADRFGRKPMFQATLLIFSVSTGLCGLAWSYAALISTRFLSNACLSDSFHFFQSSLFSLEFPCS